MAFTDQINSVQVARIRVLMNKPTETDVLDTDIESWIHEANLLYGSQGRIYEEESIEFAYTEAAATGKYEFSLGAGGDINIEDYVAIRGILHHGTSQESPNTSLVALAKIHIRMLDHVRASTALGEPRYWYIREATQADGVPISYLGIWPKPNNAAHFMKILYYRFTDDYSSGTGCPDYLQDLIRWYALSKWFERDGKYAQADQYRSYFDNLLMYYSRLRHANQSNMDSQNSLTEPDRTKLV